MVCLIVSSEACGRQLKKMLQLVNGIHLLPICGEAKEALKIACTEKIDAVFVDADHLGLQTMPFVRCLDKKQKIILMSSTGEFAVAAFDQGLTDYLLKPISTDRFLKTMSRINGYGPGNKIEKENPSGSFFVKSDHWFEKIDPGEIMYIKGLQNYITIRTLTKKIVTYSSLKGILNYLCAHEFLRVQKSFIVSVSKIDRINSDDLVIGDTCIPISRDNKASVIKAITERRLYRFPS